MTNAVVGPQQVEPLTTSLASLNVQRRSKRDVSVNSRYNRHEEKWGSMDFKRRFEETKIVLKIRQQYFDSFRLKNNLQH
jgi:hypothetical protein